MHRCYRSTETSGTVRLVPREEVHECEQEVHVASSLLLVLDLQGLFAEWQRAVRIDGSGIPLLVVVDAATALADAREGLFAYRTAILSLRQTVTYIRPLLDAGKAELMLAAIDLPLCYDRRLPAQLLVRGRSNRVGQLPTSVSASAFRIN